MGLVLVPFPFIPGWMLIVPGLYLLSIDSPKTQERILVYRARYVWFDTAFRQFERDRRPGATLSGDALTDSIETNDRR